MTNQNEVSTNEEATTSVISQSTVTMTRSPATTMTASVIVGGVTQDVQVDINYNGQIRITNVPWGTELLDANSAAYQSLESQILQLVRHYIITSAVKKRYEFKIR